MPQRTALAIRHVSFEDLGGFADPLERAGYRIDYHDAAECDLGAIDPVEADLLVVLGGPVGVYDVDTYPFLADEIAILERRLAADLPTLGICLGAQLIARALGGRVYPGPSKEIGWAPVVLTNAGRAGPLAALADVPVLHWHGDTFDLPDGCELLASTELCRHQAFARGPRVLGLQFHPEVVGRDFERWLVGHACELAATGIDPRNLRADAIRHAPRLMSAADAFIERWLEASGLAEYWRHPPMHRPIVRTRRGSRWRKLLGLLPAAEADSSEKDRACQFPS
ncbi:glutamine amidotransferase [Muricoccus pecuniae]|uniref:GMP synthase (Glutamine-hydrolyzing) n=1 Tax=Muricoccus pecuniae TaxID=693023 RepID=A0A840Y3V5_9PROT|nr:glutamine amidotransferase [Roseomonas pecuniae]MBB5695818.1 GMP synthase (glutamine-hydrolyzing) [Roseomonas pecuniae]